ncbi:MAG: transcription-repair coupling factor [Bacteroidales bacterium]|nr:transcription-repair coupling factor [Bacteroidales bacterium]
MKLPEIAYKYSEHPAFSKVNNLINGNETQNIHLKGLVGSSSGMFASEIIKLQKKSYLFILSDKEKAAYFQNDLKELLPGKDILFFPSSYKRSVIKSTSAKFDDGSVIMRTEVLNNLQTCKSCIIVTYPEALLEKVTNKDELKDNTLELTKGEEVPIDFIKEMLIEYGFELVDFVFEPGQFAVRGSIVDIFSYSNDYPYRIDFFDEEIESIRTFDTVSQLSKAKMSRISIVSDIQLSTDIKNKVSFFKFISKETIIWSDDFLYFFDVVKNIPTTENYNGLISFDETINDFNKFKTVEFSPNSYFNSESNITFSIRKHNQLNKNFDLLVKQLIDFKEQNFKSYVISKNTSQTERLKEIIQSDEILEATEISDAKEKIENSFDVCEGILHEGFSDDDLKINCYTEHQIYGRYHKFILRSEVYHKNKETLTLREINNLQAGDFVVHSDHGIGRFGGLQTVDNNGNKQEAIRLVYKDNDILLVNIHNLHKISKYKGKEGTHPRIHKLGSNVWQKVKKKTKSRVKDIARELIALYAKRKQEKGFAFSQDTYLQHALESSFIFEDTPDQRKAIDAVKEDMESAVPMDRLVCGDVGFGKTEIAIRAAFKAVADNKQVAVLVPTTVLTLQHFKTFVTRFKELPCNVDFISRLKSSAQQNETLKRLASGEIDIIIGTHRIVSKDVKFKDLGLMVIDEEQKFGVAVKEKLKALKVNVDTLTLTATPIPRTLQFSLLGARDLSIINTPPPNRQPIHTELLRFDKEVIKEALEYEFRRNGQVFFIHNRIDTIYEIESLLNRLNPNIRTAVMHGRMKPQELEKIMTGFINEDYGVLIATTIIESGLDISNANTIIINNAQNFGLSDLHQLRGRVGRSDRKAFCYLLAPPLSTLTNEARQRLKAVETFSELGSGFNIAMQDLDIRGAGNMLGGEQSGFISDIGYETYHKILDEAMHELREEEFKELFKQNKKAPAEINQEDVIFVRDCHIDTDLEVRFPETYIENTEERLRLYKKLDSIKEEQELQLFENELKDRFGTIPKASKELLNAVRLRKKAMTLGMEKILLRNGKMVCYLVSDQESMFYESDIFTSVLNFLQKYPKKTSLKERKDKLTMSFQDIKSIKDAIAVLGVIQDAKL